MRKHGWQLPYHQLQVVAVAVFLALGFAFYVFFAPFVGKKLFQYIVMGIYTPLLISSFGLYIWCAGADPADPGVFRSKKYLKNIPAEGKLGKKNRDKEAADKKGEHDIESEANRNTEGERTKSSVRKSAFCSPMLGLLVPCACVCSSNEESSQKSEDGMFYCTLCEVEVYKYSKHCRVCDKCVNRFDHHCRWLNNCIGKRNYRKFFILMISALLLLILQWAAGIIVLVFCFLEKKKFAADISSKLGSSFTVVPFVIVVAVCTVLAMIATLPLAQLFFFHILLIKKGISTYDYIIAIRDQDQGIKGQNSPQMSQVSSLTGLSSSASSFNRAAFCTPPRLFVEDQYDVVPQDSVSIGSFGKKKNTSFAAAAVKISPWTLARLNAEEVSKAASEARKKSKILRTLPRNDFSTEDNRNRGNMRIRLPSEIPPGPSLPQIQSFDSRNNADHHNLHYNGRFVSETSTSLAPLYQISAFRRGPPGVSIASSSPESSSSLDDSPEISPFRASASNVRNDIIQLSRSTSDGYDASGGEDSDRFPERISQYRPMPTTNWRRM